MKTTYGSLLTFLIEKNKQIFNENSKFAAPKPIRLQSQGMGVFLNHHFDACRILLTDRFLLGCE